MHSETGNQGNVQSLDLLAFIRLLLRHWVLVAVCVVGCAAIALTAALLTQPRYRSEAVLSVREDDMSQSALSGLAGQFGSIAQLAGLSLGRGASADQAVAVLQSWSLSQDFIERHKLVPDLSLDARSSIADLLGSEHKNLSMQRAVKYFRRKVLSVRRDKTTGLITVTAVWTDPQQAATWVNEYVHMGDSLMRIRSLQDAERSLALLKDELGKNQEVVIREAISGLVEAEMKRRVFAQARTEYALQVLDKAHASDPRDSVYPRRAWILVAGLVAGGLLSLVIIFFRLRVSGRVGAGTS
jgi:uncharacterized protein involved in exopolysaccharide biosynthesis